MQNVGSLQGDVGYFLYDTHIEIIENRSHKIG